MKKGEFYIVENAGDAWKCYSPFSSTICEDKKYENLVLKASIQLGVGLPDKSKLKVIQSTFGRTWYRAYLEDTKLRVKITKKGYGKNSVWTITELMSNKGVSFNCSYNDFRRAIKQRLGLSLPKEQALDIMRREGDTTVYSIIRKKGLPLEAWDKL